MFYYFLFCQAGVSLDADKVDAGFQVYPLVAIEVVRHAVADADGVLSLLQKMKGISRMNIRFS